MNDLLKVGRSNMLTTFAMAVSLWQAALVYLCPFVDNTCLWDDEL